MSSNKLSRRASDITGNYYGRLKVVGYHHTDTHGNAMWECRCSCGSIKIVRGHSLRSGHTSSCGCFHREKSSEDSRIRATTHGMSRSREYNSWVSMKDRCYNPNHQQYKDYGGRGIKVCDRWLNSFENFYEDMGERPEGTTLDKLNNDIDYCPSNCRWATWYEQQNNRRNTRRRFNNE